MTYQRAIKAYLLAFLLLLLPGIPLTALAKGNLTHQLKNILIINLSHSLTPGAVLLVSNPFIGTVMVAAGWSDKVKKKPMTTSNNFRIASMSKTFLAVTVLRMIEQGKLNLDDKMATLLPDSIDVNRIPNGRNVTVRQLLQMRSGIPNYTDYDAYYNLLGKNTQWTATLCVRTIYDMKADFAAGSAYEYSNTNYLLLQLIVEHINGGSYADSIHKEIIAPLNLRDTYIETHEPDNSYHLLTQGYALNEYKKMMDVTNYNDGFGMGDGGIITTTQDLNHFLHALLQDKVLLKPATLKIMLQMNDEYGLGIWTEYIEDETALSHNGLTSGFQGQYYYFPKQQLTIILLTNYFDTDIIENVIPETYRAVSR